MTEPRKWLSLSTRANWLVLRNPVYKWQLNTPPVVINLDVRSGRSKHYNTRWQGRPWITKPRYQRLAGHAGRRQRLAVTWIPISTQRLWLRSRRQSDRPGLAVRYMEVWDLLGKVAHTCIFVERKPRKPVSCPCSPYPKAYPSKFFKVSTCQSCKD